MNSPEHTHPRAGFTAMDQHPLGVPLLDVRHMCPECGDSWDRALCAVCLGVGHVDADRLDRWQQAQWTTGGVQLPVARRIRADPI